MSRKKYKAFKKEIGKKWEGIKSDRRRCIECREEWKKNEKTCEIRIRIIEKKVDKLDKNIKEIRNAFKYNEKESRNNKDIEERSTKSRNNLSIRNSCSYDLFHRSDISENRLSNKEINKLKK